jgi:hypothetical protein
MIRIITTPHLTYLVVNDEYEDLIVAYFAGANCIIQGNVIIDARPEVVDNCVHWLKYRHNADIKVTHGEEPCQRQSQSSTKVGSNSISSSGSVPTMP